MPLSMKDCPRATECPLEDIKLIPQSEKARKKVTLIVFSGKGKENDAGVDSSSACFSKYDSSLVLDNLACDTTVLDVYYIVSRHLKLNPYSFFLRKGEAESKELLSSSDLIESTDCNIHNKNVLVELVLKEELSESEKSGYALEIPLGPAPRFFGGNDDDFLRGPHRSHLEMFEQYGPIMRLKNSQGRNLILNADPYIMEEIFTSKSDIFIKDHTKNNKLAKLWFNDGLFTCDDDVIDEKEIWGIAHRILIPAFSNTGIKSYFPMISDILLNDVISKIDELSHEEIDMTLIAEHFTFDVIGKAGFNLDFRSSVTGQHRYLDLIAKAGPIALTLRQMPFLQKPFYGPSLVKQWADLNTENVEWLDTIVSKRRKELEEGINVNGKDLLTLMLTDKDPKTGKSLSDANIRYQLNTFLFAGHDSTSSAITMLLYNIAQNGIVEEKILNEIAEVVGDRELQYSDLSKLKYINQVINESLRMYPPAGAAIKACQEDTMLGNFHVPKGTSVMSSLWGVAHNPNIWPNPFKFDPDRWSPENSEGRSDFASLPFSFGVRGCIGRQVSIMEQRIFVFNIIRNYHVRVSPKCKPDIQFPLFLKAHGIYLTFEKRRNLSVPRALACVNSEKITEENIPEKETMMATTKTIKPIEESSVINILFGSNMGCCEGYAHDLESKIQKVFNCTVNVMPLNTFLDESIIASKNSLDIVATIILCSSYNGKPPDNADAFYSSIVDKKNSLQLNDQQMERLRQNLENFAIFGAGNSQWSSTFQKVPKDIQAALEGLDLSSIVPLTLGDVEDDIEDAILIWTDSILKQLMVNSGLSMDMYEAKLKTNDPIASFSPIYEIEYCDYELKEDQIMTIRDDFAIRNNFFTGEVTQNIELLGHQVDDSRSTRCVQIEIPPNATYKAGDHLAVYGANDFEIVHRVAKLLNIPDIEKAINIRVQNGDDMNIPLNIPHNKTIPIKAVFRFCLDLQRVVSRLQVEYLIHKCPCPPEKQALENMLSNYDARIAGPRITLFELLEKFRSIQLTLAEFMTISPRLKVRYYSISSSPQSLPHAVQITVGVQNEFIDMTGRKHIGICSNFLASVGPEQTIRHCFAFIKDTGSTFRLPNDSSTPLILIGPGTGVAPMLGFIRERHALSSCTEEDGNENSENQFRGNTNSIPSSAKQKNKDSTKRCNSGAINLYFGCRDDNDFIYQEELEKYMAEGTLSSLNVAFSRKKGQKKTYVQDLISKDASYLSDLILNQNAHVYICGDAKAMAPAVQKTFEKMLGGPEVVKEMISSGRYCQDVWAGSK
jgi:cytochrome P450/NADPH-cytochrome P450 reductase